MRAKFMGDVEVHRPVLGLYISAVLTPIFKLFSPPTTSTRPSRRRTAAAASRGFDMEAVALNALFAGE
jgi:hypothetical protein